LILGGDETFTVASESPLCSSASILRYAALLKSTLLVASGTPLGGDEIPATETEPETPEKETCDTGPPKPLKLAVPLDAVLTAPSAISISPVSVVNADALSSSVPM
jgi:hypothetical protein